jgi:hypothetical protein
MKVSFTLAELSAKLDVPVRAGIGSQHDRPADQLIIDGLATLENARLGKLSFLSNPRYSQLFIQRWLAQHSFPVCYQGHPMLPMQRPRNCLPPPSINNARELPCKQASILLQL